MPKRYSSKEVIRVLQRHGFVFVSQKGSHAKYRKTETGRTAIVPMPKKQLPPGTFNSIVRQADLRASDFES